MSGRRRRILALRFDVDSIVCLEKGVPNLLRLGDRLGVRFTFFVNMGRSFSWRHTITQRLRKRRGYCTPSPIEARKLSVIKKLGRSGVLRTATINPRLGRGAMDQLHQEGHELGLHGGSNHAAWQYALDELGATGPERTFRGAFEEFRDRYGPPHGFASPGFRYNGAVLDLLDREGFHYASDMHGERPFRPKRDDGNPYRHFQVPVNVIGKQRVPYIEQGLAQGHSVRRIVEGASARIRSRRFALMYGHPYVEGVYTEPLAAILAEVAGDYDIVTVGEYLRRYRES